MITITHEFREAILNSLIASMGAPNKMRFVAVLLDDQNEPLSERVEFDGAFYENAGQVEFRPDLAELHLKATRAASCPVVRVARADNTALYVDLPM